MPFRPISALVSLLPGIFIAGCVGHDAKVGQDVPINESIAFYFPARAGEGYKTLPRDDKEHLSLLLEGAEWLPPEGSTITPDKLEIRSGTVHWGTDVKYTVGGYYIDASCTLRIREDAEPGRRVVRLYLPAVAEVGKMMEAVPRAPPSTLGAEDQYFPDGRLRVRTITFHKSSVGVYWGIVWKTLLLVALVVGAVVFLMYYKP